MGAVNRDRRRFLRGALVLAGLGLLSGCRIPIDPSRSSRVHRIAFLTGARPNPGTTEQMAAFRQGLGDLGYVEGQTLLIEERYANSDDQLGEPAADVVRLQPEVILVPSATVARAAQAATTTIPIVSAGAGVDLVAQGLAASYARPGGTVTGLSTPPLAGKLLQLLRETVPALARVAVLFDRTISDWGYSREWYEAAAHALGMQLQPLGAGGAEDLDPVFDSAVRAQADGLIVLGGPVIAFNQARIGELAMQSRLPSIWTQTDAVGRGGLMAYGPNRAEMHRRAAAYVDKILKGASPANLPIEQPTVFDFVLNVVTARALGLSISQSLLQQATEVIQ